MIDVDEEPPVLRGMGEPITLNDVELENLQHEIAESVKRLAVN